MNSRVDYSELIDALQQNDEGKANELIDELLFRLKDYLTVVLNASTSDAEECAQQAFTNVYEQIQNGNIRNEKAIFSYLIKTCRHEYFRYAKEKLKYSSMDNEAEHFVEPARQMENLLNEDRQRILKECLKELPEEVRHFIEYFMDRPAATTKQASSHFKISGAYVRTKKSRILDRLHLCYKRKWQQ